eukprot:GILK01001875.1.p1 GENE.GILK01001875.1~~GILK01001875.1.p1  ORF type:complete len:684 (-),score=189.28 GILK01001875.1:192-2153(-)
MHATHRRDDSSSSAFSVAAYEEVSRVKSTLANRKAHGLNLSRKYIGPRSASLILDIILKHKVKDLNLFHNRLGDSGAVVLARAIKHTETLTKLDLGANGIGPAGAVHLAEALKHNKSLKYLDLGGNMIGVKGAAAFAEVLCFNTTLKKFRIRFTDVGERGAKLIALACRENKSLLELDGVDLKTFVGELEIPTAFMESSNEQILAYFRTIPNSPQRQRRSLLLAALKEDEKPVLEEVPFPAMTPEEEEEARRMLEAEIEALLAISIEDNEKPPTIAEEEEDDEDLSDLRNEEQDLDGIEVPPSPSGSMVIHSETEEVAPLQDVSTPHKPKPRRFEWEQVMQMTEMWSSNRVVGSGPIGTVYKGELTHEELFNSWWNESERGPLRQVAVKKLHNEISKNISNDFFVEAVEALGEYQAATLLPIIGYAMHESEMCIISPFMEGGNLETLLVSLKDKNQVSMNWAQRINMVVDVANALTALHTAGRPLVHRNVVPTNVLVDAEGHAVLSDYGQINFLELGQTSTRRRSNVIKLTAVGVPNNIMPVYARDDQFIFKAADTSKTATDIMHLGLLLLAVLTGSSMDHQQDPKQAAASLALRMAEQGDAAGIADLNAGEISTGVADELVSIVLTCLEPRAFKRPSAQRVAERLQQVSSNL